MSDFGFVRSDFRKKIVLFIIGTRPEAIKLAPVILYFKSQDGFDVRVFTTGQHADMAVNALRIFGIFPEYMGECRDEGRTLSSLSKNLIDNIDSVVTKVEPSLICVHGDTTSAMVGALVGFYKSTPVAHIEAGLRTHDLKAPFPEEGNRRIISTLTNFHFCPSKLALDNLKSEGVSEHVCFVTGNTVIDSIFYINNLIDENKNFQNSLNSRYQGYFSSSKNILVTSHRRENFGFGLQEICNAILNLSDIYDEYKFFYPVHLNPSVDSVVRELLGNKNNIILLPPLDYIDFVYMMKRCDLILTDSGGIQEEAPSLNKPVLVMRDKTERPEGVRAGCMKVIGSRRQDIVTAFEAVMNNDELYNSMANADNPYGDGMASRRIYEAVEGFLG